MRSVLDLHAHAVLFGARGAGKTSLVRAFGDHADERGHIVIYMSCGAGGDFASIFAPYLAEIPDACFAPGDRAAARAALDGLPARFDARALAAALSHVAARDLILVVDEFDQVHDPAALREIAALLKLLSDMRARVQLLFVGIAGRMGELIEAHPSLRRHLVAVPLGRFDPAGVEALFAGGEQRTGLRFTPEARETIASLATGSPYHLRLFCFCAAMVAVEERTPVIGEAEVERGLRAALAMWGSTNATAVELFGNLAAESAAMRAGLARLAREALAGDPTLPPRLAAVPPEAPSLVQRQRRAALEALAPVLVTLADDTLQFDDPLAPQLLLAASYLADREAAATPRIAAPHPSSHREAFA